MPNKITAWSFSRWKDYTQCPFKAKCKHVDKLKEPASPAMERGSKIHALAEQYTKGLIPRLPPELVKFGPEFKIVRKMSPLAEQDWAFTSQWEPCSWFDAKAWCRVKVDLMVKSAPTELSIIDHKTGKQNPDHLDQLSLYALAGMIMEPEAECVTTTLWYLDGGEHTQEIFVRSQLDKLKHEWEARTKPMLNDTRFVPTPSNKCRWCAFSKEKGGPCKF